MRELEIVGGTFDRSGGRPSRIVATLEAQLGWHTFNGGHFGELEKLDFSDTKVLLWMPQISNDETKLLPRLKERWPRLLLIASKNLDGRDFTAADMVGRLLRAKANLGITLSKEYNDLYEFTLLDPLGNEWCRTASVPSLAAAIEKRVGFLLNRVSRVGTVALPPPRVVDCVTIDPEFITVVRQLGEQFAQFVNAINPNRLLGNAATRCSFGFPAVREREHIFVTRRNVEKRTLSAADFVEVELRNHAIGYYGAFKPSVDTPMQLDLFARFPRVKYMVHGHVYVKGAPMTEAKLPCGAVEEAMEVRQALPTPPDLLDKNDFWARVGNTAVNLYGHGCLLLAQDLDFLRTVELVARPFPER